MVEADVLFLPGTLNRYKRSHANLIWFAQHANRLFVFDNSGEKAKAVLIGGDIVLQI